MNDNFFLQDKQSDGTKGLVFIGDKLLIYRRDGNTDTFPHMLDVPGGTKEVNETPYETFKREVQEEFGINVNKQTIVYARRYKKDSSDIFGWFAVAKLSGEAKDQISFGDEGEQFMLMSPEDYLARKDAWPLYQQRTQDFLSYKANK